MPRSRPRGLAPWSPTRSSRQLVEGINLVLEEYAAELPLTLRQIFYRLVAIAGYGKTEQAYERLGETVNRARRAGLIPFEAIRDDGIAELVPFAFASAEAFLEGVRRDAEAYRTDRQRGQARYLEVWVEAGGMAPMVARVVHGYGVPVYSSGGFHSLTAKYDAATRFLEREVATTVLHVGDYDPSGIAIFDSVATDVTCTYRDLDGDLASLPTFVRVAVLEEQIDYYGLETAPPKPSDRRNGFNDSRTVQAEAFAPDELAELIRRAIAERLDRDTFELVLEDEFERALEGARGRRLRARALDARRRVALRGGRSGAGLCLERLAHLPGAQRALPRLPGARPLRGRAGDAVPGRDLPARAPVGPEGGRAARLGDRRRRRARSARPLPGDARV